MKYEGNHDHEFADCLFPAADHPRQPQQKLQCLTYPCVRLPAMCPKGNEPLNSQNRHNKMYTSIP